MPCPPDGLAEPAQSRRTDLSVSVVVPVYNEVSLIEPSVAAIEEFLRGIFPRWEILFIESGSTDGSREECDRVAACHPCVRVIHEERRNGFGSAVKLGYRAATMDLVWLITVDLPFPLAAIADALPHLARTGYVISYRSRDERTLLRRIQSWGYRLLVRRLLGLKARHVNSAFKVFRREVIQGIEIGTNSWFIDAEVLYRLQELDVPMAEVPVELVARQAGRSSVGALTFLSLLREMLAFARAERRRKSSSGGGAARRRT
jgi:glycosyltransferase involved in cell wall biosynthesis